ncbi:LuxR C-terminal-related transcriptional regulator [Streptomyces bobili]|uniref:helix-turn-helix transcriptional regulator n=1 Tax=Streptomyces bobili TaxID=67280 RepID=UPI0033D04E15
MPAVAFAVGLTQRRLAARNAESRRLTGLLDQQQRQEARRAVLDERFRTARELHDTISRHMTIVTLQTGLAEYVFHSDPPPPARPSNPLPRPDGSRWRSFADCWSSCARTISAARPVRRIRPTRSPTSCWPTSTAFPRSPKAWKRRFVARGLANEEIAEHMNVSESTVKTHLHRVMTKLHLHSRAQAVVFAYETGIVRVGGPPGAADDA